MKKRFLIKTPEQLTDLGAFLKDGDVTNLVKVWTVKLRKDGASPLGRESIRPVLLGQW